jgi:predicted CoA-substrate-specific enzyme activase
MVYYGNEILKDAEIFVTSYNGERKKYQTDEHGWIQGLPNRDIREGFAAVYPPDGEVVYRMHYALEDYPYFSVHFWKAHLPLVVIFALAGIGIVAVYLIRNRMEKHNPVADDDISEITAHAYGVRVTAPKEYRLGMVIDIGGQDSKIIYLDANYNVKNFTMNDKCAAGTGKFMEVIAQILETTIDQVGALSLESTSPCDINSTCVVFAQSEVISLVARKVDRRDILAGMHLSMAKRIIKMMKKSEKGGDILMTGGGALNTGIHRAFEEEMLKDVYVAKYPQFNGAVGAALIASERGGI